MMENKIVSTMLDWLGISQSLYNDYAESINYFYGAVRETNRLNDLFGQIGENVELDLTFEELELLDYNRDKLVYFANGIHYEISEMIDNVFALDISNLLERILAINPSEITINAVDSVSINISLSDLISETIDDEEMKKDFETKCNSLDDDEISISAYTAMHEAEFWQNEYDKAELCALAADKVFTDEIRANWENIDDETKIYLINMYKNQIGIVLGDGMNITLEPVDFVNYPGYTYGESTEEGIKINSKFITNEYLKYDVDKLIDDITHEMRHQYQACIDDNPEKYSVPEKISDYFDFDLYIGSNEDYFKYYTQPIEVDAKAFAALASIY